MDSKNNPRRRDAGDAGPYGLVLLDPSGDILYANRMAQELLGLGSRHASDDPRRLAAWDCLPHQNPAFRRALRGEEPLSGLCHTIEWPDGRQTSLVLTLTPLGSRGKPVAGVVMTLARTESASRDLAVEVLESAPQPLFVFRRRSRTDLPQMRLVSMNAAAARHLGGARDEFEGKSLAEVLPAFNDGRIPADFAERVEAGQVVRTVVAPKGDAQAPQKHYAVKAFLVGEGHIGFALEEMAQPEKTDQAILQSQRHELHVRRTPLGGIEWDSNFCVRQWNPAAERIFGYPAGEAIGRHPAGLIVPASAREHVNAVWADLLAQRGGMRSRNQNITKDGRLLTCEWYNTPLVDIDGEVIGVASLVEDITDREEAQEAQLRDIKRLHLLFDSMPTGVLLVDGITRVVVYANPAAATTIGARAEHIAGRPYDKIFCLPDGARCPSPDMGESCKNVEREMRTATGERISVLKTVVPLDLDGHPHLLDSFSDITERTRIEQEIRQSRDEAESANRAKSEFLANMSHEIRTPMNAIMGLTDIVLDGELDDRQRQQLDVVQNATAGLLRLLNDILDFSKIEAGRLELEEVDFDLRTVLNEARDIAALRVQEKGLSYQSNIAADVPVELSGDPGRLRQILFNLIGNATKFTDSGGITVRADLIAKAEESVTLRFSVTDTGIGIPEEKLEDLFDAFTQADASTTRNFGGTGLGLAISKRLAEMLEGHMGVETEPGQGSNFWFTADFRRQSADTRPAAA